MEQAARVQDLTTRWGPLRDAVETACRTGITAHDPSALPTQREARRQRDEQLVLPPRPTQRQPTVSPLERSHRISVPQGWTPQGVHTELMIQTAALKDETLDALRRRTHTGNDNNDKY